PLDPLSLHDALPISVTSTDVNDYLRDCMGDAFTAKDFRTWGATLTAFRQLAATPPPPDAGERELAAVCNAVVESVAAMLGNTPADRKSTRLNSSHVK